MGSAPSCRGRLNDLPEVDAASGVRLGFAEIDGDTETVFGVDPATMGRIVDVGVQQGDIPRLGATDLAVHNDFAADRGWSIGDTVNLRFAETGTQPFDIAVIYDKNEFAGNFFMANSAFEANIPDVYDFQVYVLRNPNVTADAALTAVRGRRRRVPQR